MRNISRANRPTHNGVALGPGSPLLTPAKAKRLLGPSETEIQIAALELLVGPALKGQQRVPGAGMTMRFPELALIYAINPNSGAGGRKFSKASAGKAKGMGQLKSMPDLHLPVMRGPFIGLYVEIKRPGEYGTKEQRAMAERLRAEGHCVVECQGVQEVVDAVIAYLSLPKNFVGREILGQAGRGPIEEIIDVWRQLAHETVAPRPAARGATRGESDA